MPILIKDLIDLPEQVSKGDFVLNLTEGVDHPEETLRTYVVTPQLVSCFDNALRFVKGALEGRTSRAAYLHGSFGAGKSHFMAVLHLLLHHHPLVRSHPQLSALCQDHQWLQGKKFLLVPFHMIGAQSLEAGILGGYARYVRDHLPGAPVPAVYLADLLLDNAEKLRAQMGDERFFAELNAGKGSGSGWGKLESGWDLDSYHAARRAAPTADDRLRLVGDLVSRFFPAYTAMAQGFVDLDQGLSILSRHAHSLNYDALVLFLDELILWLASHAADLAFIQREGQKLAKLVEYQVQPRPVPIISFVARQRDLRELVGEHFTGAERLGFSDVLKHWEARFHSITLEDRNLPEIAHRRVLVPRSDEARRLLDQAFEETARVREEVMSVLLTSHGDRDMFRKVYPFSPALVEALVALSSVLQRERTALRVMLELLVEKRDTLELGQVIPVGDLFDLFARGQEAFSDVMRVAFDNARRLYHQKLLPVLEEAHGIDAQRDLPREGQDAELDHRLRAFRKDDRLVKTLLLSALVPEVEPLKGLNAARLAALNHGTVQAPIPGQERSIVLRKVKDWASRVGEIKLQGDPANPTFAVQLTGIDIETILERASAEDNSGNRRRKIRQLLFGQLGIQEKDELFHEHFVLWRGTRRPFQVLYANVRELTDEALRSDGQTWKLVLDFPFDEPGHSPREDLHRLEAFRARPAASLTLVWLPSFLSREAQQELGRLVVLDHVLEGERLASYADHLSAVDRATARVILENQRSALREKILGYLDQAYGVATASPGALDTSHGMEPGDHFHSLQPGFTPRPPAQASLRQAMENLLDQALRMQYPGHPEFPVKEEIRPAHAAAVWREVRRAVHTADGRCLIEDRAMRPRLAQIAEPLRLGKMAETHFVLDRFWLDQFQRKLHEEHPDPLTVGHLDDWMDQPDERGLPRHLRDLPILLFAEQTHRRFVHYGRDLAAEPGRLQRDVVLLQQVLPTDQEWARACARAEKILGIPVPELCNATNVLTLGRQIREKAEALEKEARELPEALLRGMQALGMDPSQSEQADRLRTARAARDWLASLRQAPDDQAVRVAAEGEPGAGEAALKASLLSAASNRAALRQEALEVLAALAGLRDGRKEKAEQILSRLRTAILQDESVRSLAPEVQQAHREAVQLLVGPEPEPGPGPTLPPAPSGQVVAAGERTGLSAHEAVSVLEGIRTSLRDGYRLDVSWKVYGPEAGA